MLRCPADVGPHLPGIIDLCLAYLSFDPNYQEVASSEEEEEDSDSEYVCAVVGVSGKRTMSACLRGGVSFALVFGAALW